MKTMVSSDTNESQKLHWRTKDITGKKFSRLTVIGPSNQRTKNRLQRWNCVCDCGATTTPTGYSLINGETKSCGCWQKEKAREAGNRTRTHGKTKTTEHTIWTGMIQRCHNQTSKDFYSYGAKGITVCERWRTFENFFADMGERPAGKSLDRIDNAKGYSPVNCRWATASEQARNSSSIRLITINGRTQPVCDWLAEAGIKHSSTYWRRVTKSGWSIEKALTTPPGGAN